MTVLQDLGFIAAYECRLLSNQPGPEVECIVFGNSESTNGFVFVEVNPRHGLPWIGRFKAGEYPFSGLFACPNERFLCVVAGGFGYWVEVFYPRQYETLRVKPVQGVARVPGRPILVCWDFQDLAAYGVTGLEWWIERLSEDDLEITKLEPDGIRGSAWNPADDTRTVFCIDPLTGSATPKRGRIRRHR